MEISKTENGMILHQRKYVREGLKRFNMLKFSPTTSLNDTNFKLEKNENKDKVNATMFKKIIGSLRYLCNNRPRVSHMKVARIILMY